MALKISEMSPVETPLVGDELVEVVQSAQNRKATIDEIRGEDYHSHSNKAILDATTASYTVAEQSKLGVLPANAYSISESDALLLGKEDKASKGVADGYASLGSDGKIPVSQLPQNVLDKLGYKGFWNATTNSITSSDPDINGDVLPAAGSDNEGWYFIVQVAGSTSIDGISDWKVGDWVISYGTAWTKIDNTDAIVSFNSRTGAITPAAGDYNASQITFTPVAGITDTDVQQAIARTAGRTATYSLPNSVTGFNSGRIAILGRVSSAAINSGYPIFLSCNFYETGLSIWQGWLIATLGAAYGDLSNAMKVFADGLQLTGGTAPNQQFGYYWDGTYANVFALRGDAQVGTGVLDFKYSVIDPSGTWEHVGTWADATHTYATSYNAISSRVPPPPLTSLATLDFPGIASLSVETLNVTVAGARTGMAVSLGLPSPPPAGVIFDAYVSASDVVTVRASNFTGGAVDPASNSFRITVHRH